MELKQPNRKADDPNVEKLAARGFSKSILRDFEDHILQVIGSPEKLSITFIEMFKETADDTLKFLVSNEGGDKVAFVLCSNPIARNLVERHITNAEEVAEVLPAQLSVAVIRKMQSGYFNDLSYVILPYHVPLTETFGYKFLWKRLFKNRIFEWLRGVTLETRERVTGVEYSEHFLEPLKAIQNSELFGHEIRGAAGNAQTRLANKEWVPCHVLAHNDFTVQNLLQDNGESSNEYGFIATDWPGMKRKGTAFIDLIALSGSLAVSDSYLLKELQKHAEILDCSPSDAMGYLLAGFGLLGQELYQFPENQYQSLVNKSFARLNAVLRS